MGLPECAPPSSLPEEQPPQIESQIATSQASTSRRFNILVDDFTPQPYQGESVYFFNRLEGDRGAINDSLVDWGNGQMTMAISSENSWGGVWMSINHPIREGIPINFSAILPSQILPAYQSQITGITINVKSGTPNRIFKIELKYGNDLEWTDQIRLNGAEQVVSFDLPALGNISQLVFVLDDASESDSVILDSVSFIATTQITDTATTAFVWSYGMLLNNWNTSTGLMRDKARDASGEFNAIQATGSLAAATALAQQFGVVDRQSAISIVNKINDTLLNKIPRKHGLWPHWVRISDEDEIEIVPNTEWSSVDTVIAAIGLLDAQQSLGLSTVATEEILREIEWKNLVTEKGISHGYTYDEQLIPYAWDVFGGESWLVELVYASATGEVTSLAYPAPPTANGSGFIDELAWLYVMPPMNPDYWGNDWTAYRVSAVDKQISYYAPDTASCFARFGLFGLSAAETPAPARVPKENIYQAFGMGGQFAPVNDGTVSLGSSVVIPHYSGMIASLRPQAAINMWHWLIVNGYFSPLTNVESLTFPLNSNCAPNSIAWNHLKGSWNLALQTLGWGRYLAERDGNIPAVWQATKSNPFLQNGYLLLTTKESSSTP
jgi:hypothetical protein